MITEILKRDGRTAVFNISKISAAIEKAFEATGVKSDAETPLKLAQDVEKKLEEKLGGKAPTVEQIQDVVF